MKRDEFGGRYAVKLISSVFIAVLNMVIQLTIPRALSVPDYGYFTYNLNVFTSVVVLANLSASNALVAKYARRCEEYGMVRFYIRFFVIVTLILNIGVVAVSPFAFYQKSFAGQTIFVVLLGLESAVLTKLITDVVSLYDSAAISRFPAFMQAVMKAAVAAFVIIGYVLNVLNLAIFYIGQGIITLVVILILLYEFKKDHKANYENPVDLGTKAYLKEFFEYCKPLILANAVAQLVVILMNYALMGYSGATEQAMFGAAWQLNTLVSYVFSPYAELLKREFAVCMDDKEELKHRFSQALRMMMWITSYFSIFIAVFARELLPVIYGDKYNSAVLVTQMIMVYTSYQAWGQVTGSFTLSTGRTRFNGIMTIVVQILTVICIFVFQIPNPIFPKGLGANGIAINYLLVNIISVVFQVTYLSHELGLSVIRENLTQLLALGACTALSFAFNMLVSPITVANTLIENILKVLSGGILYSICFAVLIYMFPGLIGLSRERLKAMIGKAVSKVKKK